MRRRSGHNHFACASGHRRFRETEVRSFLARDELSLDGLEPYIGLDPLVERSGEQLGLFGE